MTKNIIEVSPEKFPWLDTRRFTFALGVEKNGVVFLAGHTASTYDAKSGHVVCKGDVVEQTKVCMEKLGAVLEAAGMSFDNVVKTVDYIDPRALPKFRDTAEVRRQYLGEGPVASTGIMMHGLLRPDALIEIRAVAVSDPRERIIPPGVEFEGYKKLTYAPGVKSGNMVWLSGYIGGEFDAAGKRFFPQDTARQTELCHQGMDKVLKAAGATPADVVNSVDYISPQAILQYPNTNRVREDYYQGQYPASTGIVINRLLRSTAHLELELVAVTDSQREEVRIPAWEEQYRNLPYVPAIKKGKLMFFSGQSAIDHTNGRSVAPHDVVGQATKAYENLAEIVSAAGYTMDDIVNTIEFLPPNALDGYRGVQEVRRKFFGDRFPAATGILAHQLVRPELMVEVVAVAVV